MDYKTKGFQGRPLLEGIQGKPQASSSGAPTVSPAIAPPRLPPTGGAGTAKPTTNIQQPRKNS